MGGGRLDPHGGGLGWAKVDVEAGCASEVAGPGATEEGEEHGSCCDSVPCVGGGVCDFIESLDVAQSELRCAAHRWRIDGSSVDQACEARVLEQGEVEVEAEDPFGPWDGRSLCR